MLDVKMDAVFNESSLIFGSIDILDFSGLWNFLNLKP